MIHLKEFIEYLDDQLDVPSIDDYAPNGLQIEGEKKEVRHIVTAVSASLETIKKTIEIKPDVLIVHHGLFWKKDTYRIMGIKREKIKLLLDHGITLLAYHLPLDCHKEWGNNWRAAKEMGWTNLKDFGPKYSDHPIGVMGELNNIHLEEFQKMLEKYYEHRAHTALGGPKTIKSAALISGGAHKEIERAIQQPVDAFITGSFDEPTWHMAYEGKINFFAMGHSNTERIGPRTLGDHLAKKFNLKHEFLDFNNPF